MSGNSASDSMSTSGLGGDQPFGCQEAPLNSDGAAAGAPSRFDVLRAIAHHHQLAGIELKTLRDFEHRQRRRLYRRDVAPSDDRREKASHPEAREDEIGRGSRFVGADREPKMGELIEHGASVRHPAGEIDRMLGVIGEVRLEDDIDLGAFLGESYRAGTQEAGPISYETTKCGRRELTPAGRQKGVIERGDDVSTRVDQRAVEIKYDPPRRLRHAPQLNRFARLPPLRKSESEGQSRGGCARSRHDRDPTWGERLF